MEKLGLFVFNCLVMIPIVLIQGWVGWLLLDHAFHLGYGTWVGVSAFANMYAPVAVAMKS